jgi:hypothetical protein
MTKQAAITIVVLCVCVLALAVSNLVQMRGR